MWGRGGECTELCDVEWVFVLDIGGLCRGGTQWRVEGGGDGRMLERR